MTIHAPVLEKQHPNPFTNKQWECVLWASYGKTSSETGVITGYNSRSVERRLKEAMERADVVNKTSLVAKAIREGWID
jgi:LuxR family quorum-sensing system transcriptional regulator CciR